MQFYEAVIPTVSMLDLYDHVTDGFDNLVYHLQARSEYIQAWSTVQLTPYMRLSACGNQREIHLLYNRRVHGPFDMANALRLTEESELLDLIVNAISLRQSPLKPEYLFLNVRARPEIAGKVREIRKRLMLRRGLGHLIKKGGGKSLLRCLTLRSAHMSDGGHMASEELGSLKTIEMVRAAFGNLCITIRLSAVPAVGQSVHFEGVEDSPLWVDGVVARLLR